MSDRSLYRLICTLPGARRSRRDLTRQSVLIEGAVTLLENERPAEAFRRLAAAERELDSDYFSGPLIDLLKARAAHEACLMEEGSLEELAWFREVRLNDFMTATNTLAEGERRGQSIWYESPGALALANIRFLLQYALYHLLEIAKEMKVDVGNDFPEAWHRHGFEDWNRYQGLDPMVLRACPPHHIWKEYSCDEFLYRLEGNELVETLAPAT